MFEFNLDNILEILQLKKCSYNLKEPLLIEFEIIIYIFMYNI